MTSTPAQLPLLASALLACSLAPACDSAVVNADFDGDGTIDEQDCDPADASVHPGADEICDDGIDNDCDGLVDGMDDPCQDPCAIQMLEDIAGRAVAIGCDGLSQEGCCDGELLYWCEDDYVCLMDCEAVGVHCGWKATPAIYDCKTSGVGAPDDDPPMTCPADYPEA